MGQKEEKRRALAKLALDPDLPAVRLDDALGNLEPQAGAVACALFGLPEAVEEVRYLLGRDAAAGIR